jgi:cytidylate kinase
MGLITVTGQTGCRPEEVARIVALRLGFHLVTETRIQSAIENEFAGSIPDKAYPDVLASILAHLAVEEHLIVVAEGAESLAHHFPGALRVLVSAPETARVGRIMLDQRLERPAAKEQLKELETHRRQVRRRRFGRGTPPAEAFDMVLNTQSMDGEQMAQMIEAAAHATRLPDFGYLSAEAEAQLQFQLRLRLARHGIAPPGTEALRKKGFAHASEEIFANLLDFYRIPWEYEPRSFPVEWDEQGNMTVAFTPDFYLPEVDMYVELTTMKQSLVTKKNRKVKRLREIYPHVNIQVFYLKDFQNLIFKYGLAERLVTA